MMAMKLLRDNAFDALLTSSAPIDALPAVMARLADGDTSTICHTVDYEGC